MSFFIKKPVATLMLFGALLLMGAIAFFKLKISLFPEINFPEITVITPYPDAPPDEVENLISIPVEKAAGGVSGVRKIQTRSEEGVSIVKISLDWKSSREMSMILLRQKLDQIKYTLPRDAEKSILMRFDPSSDPVMILTASPVKMEFNDLRDYLDGNIIPSFERIEGVASVFVSGGLKREIGVDLDMSRLNEFKLTPQRIAEAIRHANYDYPSGNVRENDREHTIRFMGQFQSPADLNDVPVPLGSNNKFILLKQIADIRDGYRERTGSVLHNSKPVILIELRKEPGHNTLSTAENVKTALKKIHNEFPDVRFSVIHDSSLHIKEAVGSIRNSAVTGAFAAAFILFLFLRSIASSLVVSLTIPVSVLNTFLFMYLGDVSINLMSLGGLSLGTGMLVDNAIISLESISDEIEKHPARGRIENTINGIKNVKYSLLASTSTSIVIFLPIIFMPGITGALFKDLAFTVSCSLLSSLFCSLTLVPVLFLFFSSGVQHPLSKHLTNFMKPAFQTTDNVLNVLKINYTRILNYYFLRTDRLVQLYIAAAAVGILMFLTLERTLFQKTDSGIISAEINLPEGMSFEETEQVTGEFHSYMLSHSMIRDTVTEIGYETDHPEDSASKPRKESITRSTIFINKDRISGDEFINLISNKIKSFRNVRASFSVKKDPLQDIFGNENDKLKIKISGKKRPEIKITAEKVLNELKSLRNIRSFSTADIQDPEIEITINREKAALTELRPSDAGMTIRSALAGIVPTTFKKDEKEFDIRVRLRPEDRDNPEKIKYLHASASGGGSVPIGEIIELREKTSPSSLMRENQSYIETVTIETDGEDKAAVLNNIERIVQKLNSDTVLPSGTAVEIENSNAETMKSFYSLGFSFLLSMVFMYQILAAQFESLIHPFTASLSTLLIFAGSSLLLLFTGNGVNIASGTGIILLGGIQINTSIILYENFLNNLNAEKKIFNKDQYRLHLRKIITKSLTERIRPILLTALTTVCGMLPMLISVTGEPSPQESLAAAVTGGLLFSTALSPVFFSVFFYAVEIRMHDFRTKIKTQRAGREWNRSLRIY